MSDDLSVISQLQGFEWSSEESVAYEAAIEAVNGAVGALSGRIAAERDSAAPDPSVIERAKARRTQLAREREQLDPSNHPQIAEARRHYTELAEAVREGRAW
ncbi:hypothetical protein [Streptomyces sp. NRRL F-525]|uniref:hypothetical protein n=1 Tax=Streptomyces sp. NRRL F-525 TaxID=1463861 RepID=UPI001F19C150|nr:hypothetical protein [Streptomyces sp. NRRL F-525]